MRDVRMDEGCSISDLVVLWSSSWIAGGDGSGESGSQGVGGDGGDDTSGDWKWLPAAGGAGHRVVAGGIGGRAESSGGGVGDGRGGGCDGGSVSSPGGVARWFIMAASLPARPPDHCVATKYQNALGWVPTHGAARTISIFEICIRDALPRPSRSSKLLFTEPHTRPSSKPSSTQLLEVGGCAHPFGRHTHLKRSLSGRSVTTFHAHKKILV